MFVAKGILGMPSTFKRCLHFADPHHRTGKIENGLESADGYFSARSDPEEAVYMRGQPQIICKETAQVV